MARREETMRAYTAQVLAQLRRVTAAERRAIAREIDAHIDDHALALVERGYTEAEANERAEACMGDPVEAGRALNAQYRGWWLVIVRRLAQAVCVYAAVLCLLLLPSTLAGTAENLAARFGRGTEDVPYFTAEAAEAVDCRSTLGDDVLRVTRVAVGTMELDGEEVRAVCVTLCAYDKLPWGTLTDALHTSWTLVSADGGTSRARGAQYTTYSDARGSVRAQLLLPLAAEETEVTFRAARFGETVEQRLTLPEVEHER